MQSYSNLSFAFFAISAYVCDGYDVIFISILLLLLLLLAPLLPSTCFQIFSSPPVFKKKGLEKSQHIIYLLLSGELLIINNIVINPNSLPFKLQYICYY